MKVEFWGTDVLENCRRGWGEMDHKGKPVWFEVYTYPSDEPDILFYALTATEYPESPKNFEVFENAKALKALGVPNVPDIAEQWQERIRDISFGEAKEEAKRLFSPRKETYRPEVGRGGFSWFSYSDFDPEPEGWDVDLHRDGLIAYTPGQLGTEYRIDCTRMLSWRDAPATAREILDAATPVIREFLSTFPQEEDGESSEELRENPAKWHLKQRILSLCESIGMPAPSEAILEQVASGLHPDPVDERI